MCYSPEVSLGTFIFALISFIIIIKSKKINIKYLLIAFTISLIQLLEYFAWTYIKNKKIIRILSIIGLGIIGLQILLINYFLLEGNIRIISLTLLLIIILLFIVIELPNVNFDMKRGENLHLIWYWLDLPLIWIIIGLSFYIIPAFLNKSKSKLIAIVVLIMLLISLYFYYKYKTWGTMWCYFSNLVWIYFLIIINK